MKNNEFTELEEKSLDHIGKLLVENNKLKEELIWYKSQDLIKREDIKEYFHFDNIDDNVRLFACWKDIEQIPKAEPPASYQQVKCIQSDEPTSSKMERVGKDINVPSKFATDTNVARNGDCSTCNNYDKPICEQCIYGNGYYTDNYYEPYIPKEDE